MNSFLCICEFLSVPGTIFPTWKIPSTNSINPYKIQTRSWVYLKIYSRAVKQGRSNRATSLPEGFSDVVLMARVARAVGWRGRGAETPRDACFISPNRKLCGLCNLEPNRWYLRHLWWWVLCSKSCCSQGVGEGALPIAITPNMN